VFVCGGSNSAHLSRRTCPAWVVPVKWWTLITTILTYAIAASSSLGSPPSGSLIRAIDSNVK